MSGTVTPLNDRIASLDSGYVLEAQGLVITRELTRTEWMELGRTIVSRIEGSTWALGDWLIEGGRNTRQWHGGSSYEKASQITGYSKAHLSNAFRVAETFPKDSRRPTLSWSVHRETMRLASDLRGPVLSMAIAKKWSADDVCEHVNKLAHEAKAKQTVVSKASAVAGGTKKPVRQYYQSPKVRCPKCKHEFPIKGHKV